MTNQKTNVKGMATQIIIYQSEDGKVSVDTLMKDESCGGEGCCEERGCGSGDCGGGGCGEGNCGGD